MRTGASVDSQSVDTTSGGEERGRDNAQSVRGRRRHIVLDTMGLLPAVLVTAADVDDAKGTAKLFARLRDQPMSRVKDMYADSTPALRALTEVGTAGMTCPAVSPTHLFPLGRAL